ncbi:hypothetical protein SMKI_05G2190 [Saccharomyces mikatae IFO 1815]|uniref:YER137C-like protein n=1 Tax=Saccharomyces mikatae IFO 1815 TaxID=226126 RepID=A0AA35IX73_SACMI|nr:uncharacterized protein SMKI_05G2190 [Saccharomyces mikatae IFO 1815]CAI4038608.1 hypothetical protein SMKI_05G2190 [Saccharomyces mikatae IFO 1815]
MGEPSKRTENDIIRLSQAMDSLAKLIISKRKDGSQLQVEYNRKLKELENFINLLLGLNENTGSNVMNTSVLDVILRNGIDILEKDDQKYALIPIIPKTEVDAINNAQVATSKRSGKKKKNKIKCSFCHQVGHTRARCDVRLTVLPKE